MAVDFSAGPVYEVAIAGDSRAEDTKAMLKALRSRFLPNAVVLFRPVEEESPRIDRISWLATPYGSPDGRATAYICKNRQCQPPISDIGKMLELLDS
jgi:uncharacterized protein YyaL (SSP411 family)